MVNQGIDRDAEPFVGPYRFLGGYISPPFLHENKKKNIYIANLYPVSRLAVYLGAAEV